MTYNPDWEKGLIVVSLWHHVRSLTFSAGSCLCVFFVGSWRNWEVRGGDTLLQWFGEFCVVYVTVVVFVVVFQNVIDEIDKIFFSHWLAVLSSLLKEKKKELLNTRGFIKSMYVLGPDRYWSYRSNANTDIYCNGPKHFR